MKENDSVSRSYGYELDDFLKLKEKIQYKTQTLIQNKRKSLKKTNSKIRSEVKWIPKKEILLNLASGITISVGIFYLDQNIAGNSYIVCLVTPALMFGSSYIIDKKITNDKIKLNKDLDRINSIGLYNLFSQFLSGECVRVESLRAIYEQCMKDKFKEANKLLCTISLFNDEEDIYVEELCFKNNKLVKELIKD